MKKGAELRSCPAGLVRVNWRSFGCIRRAKVRANDCLVNITSEIVKIRTEQYKSMRRGCRDES